MKNLLIGLGLVLLFLSGVWVTNYYHQRSNMPPQEQATILLEQINKVCKLVTVEGHFVEYFDYKEAEAPLFIGPIINFEALLPQKAAKLRITAKVLVGYDLEKIKLETDAKNKKVILSNLPDPSIIAIEHQLDRFDNISSIFRPLNSDDYVKIDQGAQKKIEKMALSGSLLKSAEEQGNELLELIEFMVQNAGWTVEYRDQAHIPEAPSIQ